MVAAKVKLCVLFFIAAEMQLYVSLIRKIKQKARNLR